VNTAQAAPAPDLYLAPPARCSNRVSGSLCLCDAWCTSFLTSLILLLVIYWRYWAVMVRPMVVYWRAVRNRRVQGHYPPIPCCRVG